MNYRCNDCGKDFVSIIGPKIMCPYCKTYGVPLEDVSHIRSIQEIIDTEVSKTIALGSCDKAVVERFNELVKEGKIYCSNEKIGCTVATDKVYRLRPYKKYRPFTAVEAAAQLGREIKILYEGKTSEWSVEKTRIFVGWHIDFEKALETIVFTDTGLPFGVEE